MRPYRGDISNQDLRRLTQEELHSRPRTPRKPKTGSPFTGGARSNELDLHKKTVEEAIPLVDTFLEAMYCAGERRVRIVHGKGTGILRREVRRFLEKHSLVKSSAQADGTQGGEGATQVELVD